MAIVWDDEQPQPPPSSITWDDEQSSPLSTAASALKALFLPARAVRGVVGQNMTNVFQTTQDAAMQSPGGRLVQAITPAWMRTIIGQALNPKVAGDAAGTLASLPVDPSTYAFGGIGQVPSTAARAALGTAAGGMAGYGESGGSPVATLLGALTGGIGSAATKVTPAGIQPGIKNPIPTIQDAFSRAPTPANMDELAALPEAEAAKLPGTQRQMYLQQKAREASQQLAQDRLEFTQRAQKVKAFIAQREATNQAALPAKAAEDLANLGGSFRDLARKQNAAYKTGINAAISEAEQASGEKITFTKQQLDDLIAKKFLRLGQTEDPVEYRQLTALLDKYPVTNPNEIPAREVLDIADKEYQSVGRAAKQHARAFTPAEVASQHLRDVLLDGLEQKGIDVTKPKQDWAQWVPVRNLGLKLQTEGGPGKLVGILKGRNPVAAKHLDSLEALLGEQLDRQTKAVFNQLDYLKQQEVIQQAKQAEFQRVMQQQRQFATNSAADRALRVETLAQHRANIKKIVFGAAAGLPFVGAGIAKAKKFFGHP